jgi:hypothetical protein
MCVVGMFSIRLPPSRSNYKTEDHLALETKQNLYTIFTICISHLQVQCNTIVLVVQQCKKKDHQVNIYLLVGIPGKEGW